MSMNKQNMYPSWLSIGYASCKINNYEHLDLPYHTLVGIMSDLQQRHFLLGFFSNKQNWKSHGHCKNLLYRFPLVTQNPTGWWQKQKYPKHNRLTPNSFITVIHSKWLMWLQSLKQGPSTLSSFFKTFNRGKQATS